MKYRAMQISNYEPVIQLWRNCEGLSRRDADSRAGLEKYLEPNPGFSFVVADGSRIGGSIMPGLGGKRGYIQHLAVDATPRQRGVATKLLALCLEALKLQGIENHMCMSSNRIRRGAITGPAAGTQRAEIVMHSFTNGDNKNT